MQAKAAQVRKAKAAEAADQHLSSSWATQARTGQAQQNAEAERLEGCSTAYRSARSVMRVCARWYSAYLQTQQKGAAKSSNGLCTHHVCAQEFLNARSLGVFVQALNALQLQCCAPMFGRCGNLPWPDVHACWMQRVGHLSSLRFRADCCTFPSRFAFCAGTTVLYVYVYLYVQYAQCMLTSFVLLIRSSNNLAINSPSRLQSAHILHAHLLKHALLTQVEEDWKLVLYLILSLPISKFCACNLTAMHATCNFINRVKHASTFTVTFLHAMGMHIICTNTNILLVYMCTTSLIKRWRATWAWHFQR